jgi:hypothetical protein
MITNSKKIQLKYCITSAGKGCVMVLIKEFLDNINMAAIALPDDKLNECKYFFNLLKSEPERDKFRWLLSAFLGACYSCIEIKAKGLYHAFNDPDTGETYKDEEALEFLNKFVITKQSGKDPYYVNTKGLDVTIKTLYEMRHENIHSYSLSISIDREVSPNKFYIGHIITEKVPAIEFCQNVIDLLEGIYQQT